MSGSADTTRAFDDVAIIGMACLFPQAPDLETFWRNILTKVDATSDPPADAWHVDVAYDQTSKENDRVYCKRGGYLGPIAHFNPFEHGVMPRAAEGGDPDQWLALQVAKQALVDAGYPDGPSERRDVAVIVGKGNYITRGNSSMVQHGHAVDQMLGVLKKLQPGLSEADLSLIRDDLKRKLPRFDAESAGALVPNILAGRIANRLDLMGPSYTVDAACASSLVAVELAVRGLRHGEYQMALAGGAHVATPYTLMSLFCQLGALSRTERIRPFDQGADGTLMSEGLAMVVLKRRADAERDGDRIYAVIKGVGVASDGRAVSVLAPRVEGEELALRRAYESSGIDPATISLIEAHGTGTLVGDAVEIEALRRVFPERGERLPWCALGTVKSMIGHTLPAAGMAGLIRVALALYHKVLPATLHVTQPNPRLELERTPFYLNTETRPWIHRSDAPRRAGINAFGFGGINAHLIVEEHPAADEGAGPGLPLEWDSEVVLVRGESRADLVERAHALRQRLEAEPATPLAELACDLNLGQPGPGASREVSLALVASSTADLGRKLDRALGRLASPSCRRIKEPTGIYFTESPLARSGKLAFLFPGEGSQFVDMLADLCLHFPKVRACFDEMDRVMSSRTRGGWPGQLVMPPPPFSEAEREAAEQRLFRMDAAIEAVITANHALHTLLTDLGIRPDVMVGHSTGEYSAMRAAGMLDEPNYPEHLRRLNRLYEASLSAVPTESTLLAVGGGLQQIREALGDVSGELYVAMDNCPHQVVLIGAKELTARAAAALVGRGLLCETLAFDRAYHTPVFARFADTLREFQDAWIVAPPRLPLYSCTTVAPFPADLAEIRRISLDHWVSPVRFTETIERMHRDGVRLFVEVGPRGNLTAFVDDILGDRPHVAVAASVSRRSGLAQLNHLIGQLAAHGVPMRLDALYSRRVQPKAPPAPVEASARARAAGRMTLATGWPAMELSDETAARVRGSRRSVPGPAASPVEAAAAAPLVSHDVSRLAVAVEAADPATSAMSIYLQTMEQFLGLQQRVMQGLTGADPGAGVADAIPAPAESDAPGETDVATLLRFPFIDRVETFTPGEHLVALCEASIERYPFLRDHTFGREVSRTDPTLLGWTIMPLTMSMEILAEGGASLMPDLTLVGMRDVRTYRWIALETPSVRLRIIARRQSAEAVHVQIREADADHAGGAPATPIIEGVMVFAERYPDAPPARPFGLREEAPFRWAPDRLYEEIMFHGPSMQGVRSMDRVGLDGSEATLEVLPWDGMFTDADTSRFVTDGNLLDQVGQVVGFWAAQVPESPCLVPPFRLETLQLYGPPLAPRTRVTCQARTALMPDQQVRSELDVLDPSGRLWARLIGWENRRFPLPPSFYRYLLTTRDLFLSEPWTAPAQAGLAGCRAYRLGVQHFLDGWFTTHGGFWRRVFAHLVLSRRERDIWYAMRGPESRRVEWLLGRMAAKDGVRHLLRDQHGLELCPADVEILPDANGKPTVGGPWTDRVPSVPAVSISHAEGLAVALVGFGTDGFGLGVDLERIGRLNSEAEALAFTPEEQHLLSGLRQQDVGEWPLRFWCAKEAVAKAIGEGMRFGPRALAVRRVDSASGVMEVSVAGDGVAMAAFTARDGDLVVAVSATGEPRSMRE